MEEKKVVCIRDAMYLAFVSATDPFVEYDQFVARRLNIKESVDVYLAYVCRLTTW